MPTERRPEARSSSSSRRSATAIDVPRGNPRVRRAAANPGRPHARRNPAGGANAARSLATRFGAVVLPDPRRGISEAINVGVRTATDEEYYAWIGDDDLFREGGLRTLRDMLDPEPTAVVAYGGCDYVDPEGRKIGTSRAGRAAQWLLPWGPDLIPHPGSHDQA